MKIRPISDIHLEFGEFDLPVMENESEQVLCLNGDLNPVKNLWEVDKATKSTEYFFNSLQNRFKEVVYITGNHEYYYGDVNTDDEKFRNICEMFGYRFLQNGEHFDVGDTRFIGATLWSDFERGDPHSLLCCKDAMNDFRFILDSALEPREMKTLYGSSIATFTPHCAWSRHNEHRDSIFKKVTETPKEMKIVVMSHHAPSYQSISEGYKESYVNGAYYSDLEKQILEHDINLWLHGHMHQCFDYKIGKTRVICNPRGYNKYETTHYNNTLTIEI